MQLRIFTSIAVVVVLLCGAFPIAAKEQQVLHWSDIETAIDQHPAIQIANDRTSAAGAEIGISRQYPNPELGTSIGQGRSLDGSETALIWGIQLEIPIDAPGVYLNKTEAAKAGYQAAKFEAIARRLDVIRQLKGLFIKVAIGQESLRIQSASVEQLNQLVQVARMRVKQGQARPIEVSRLEIEQEKLLADFVAAEKKLGAIRETLNLWLGGKLPANFEVETDWRKLPDIPQLDQVIDFALNRHPLLLAASQQILASEAQTRVEKHRLFPDIKLGGFYDRELDSHNYGGMLSIELPLWNWNRGSIVKARATESATRHQRELAERELLAAIHQAHANASQFVQRARRYEESILPKARQTGEAIESMYRVGEMDIINVLDARRSLIETEKDMLTTFTEGWLAYLYLITLMGDEHE